MKKYVITGGPSTGKTSVINCLSNRGFNVSHETARKIVVEEKITRPDMDLERKIYNQQLENEDLIVSDTFFDRGLPDVLAYSKFFLGYYPEEFDLSKFKARYDKVFLLDRLPFIKDGVRYETPEEAEKLHNEIINAYSFLNYNLVRIPVLSIEDRTKMIIDSVKL